MVKILSRASFDSMKYRRRTLALSLLLEMLAACGGEDDESDLASYFAVQAYQNEDCNKIDGKLAGRQELRLFHHGKLAVRPLTQALASYYRRYGLSFFASASPVSSTGDYAINTNSTAIERALTKEFPDLDPTDEAALKRDAAVYAKVLKFVSNFILRPIVDFAQAHNAGPGVTNFVVLPHLIRPGDVNIAPRGESLAGLAVSPALLSNLESKLDETNIWEGVDLPVDFTPMIFLDANAIDRWAAVSPIMRDLVVAHEFGHTGGLLHRSKAGNLMNTGLGADTRSCADLLENEQLATMRAALAVKAPIARALRFDDEEEHPVAAQHRPQRSHYRPFPPRRLVALLKNDPEAIWEFIAPLFHER